MTSPPGSSPPDSTQSTVEITSLDDLNAFNYATLKKEKERAESARDQMAKSLEAALRRIDALELEVQRLKSHSLLHSEAIINSASPTQSNSL